MPTDVFEKIMYVRWMYQYCPIVVLSVNKTRSNVHRFLAKLNNVIQSKYLWCDVFISIYYISKTSLKIRLYFNK